ncbi:hypothetical protein Pla175_46310 [Pirellulimonas nuda]|uniref:DUF1598 domain-containing protein n=1 Tax=Pirellulimonas nuda TaxID=2528009 RepID=A0A518DIA4_9BACT|nr:DUF1598 domain-containing protein [Pirellulimonas nuda]QDU91211.1 hypothetical protein Pla175_46310 [Pirellulimonas nuda]
MLRSSAVMFLGLGACLAAAQNNPLLGPGGLGPGFGQQGGGPAGQVGGLGVGGPAQGGAQNADFDSLIDLIITTVAPDTWNEAGGGPGDIRPFPIGGVWVDAGGVMRQRKPRPSKASLGLARQGARAAPRGTQDPRTPSGLRYVSLGRLEAEIARRTAAGEPLEEAMLTLAGLGRVRYAFAIPETHDIVLAGPAGDWRVDQAGRIVSTDSGAPVVRLDDLLTLLRAGRSAPGGAFGCSINPRAENLAATQALLGRSGAKPLAPGRRDAWLEELRGAVGEQDIEVFGIDPHSRVARVLVEADHHMKLVGMGLADGVLGVESYLDTIELDDNGAPPPMSVLRWWFTLCYTDIDASAEGDAYELAGPGARVLSENELLTARGERIHTGQSDELTQRFAHSFSQHFAPLCAKHPVYGELRAVFDLALVAAMVWDPAQGLAPRAQWDGGLLVDAQRLPLPRYAVPRTVESVVNHRQMDRRTFVAGVSGGVWVDAGGLLKEHAAVGAGYTELSARRPAAPAAAAQWWWDAP